jgi:phage I-like protein
MKLIANGRPLQHYEFAIASDSLVAADGTIWSHAATLGTRFKGDTFTIDRPTVENFVTVFTSGYPKKVPVDYEHASTTDDPEVRKLRAQGLVPKAGDVVELRGVFSSDDFTGDLKSAAEKLSAQASRPLDDPRNLGLWMRWKPTSRALNAIKAGEYTELSIAFDEDLPRNTDGAGQGPGLWAVALLNTPFLDDMLPVAAGRDSDTPPGGRSATLTPERPMNAKLIALVAAVRGKPVSTEDEAIAELTAHQTEMTELRALVPFRDVIVAEFSNEKDAAKIVGTIRELRASVAAADLAAKDAKTKELKATVDATMEKHKAKLTVPLRSLMAGQLTTELAAGKKLDETDTVKALESMKTLGIFTQDAAGDIGGAATDDDVKIDVRANELLDTDPRLKALAARSGRHEAYKEAVVQAGREILVASRN